MASSATALPSPAVAPAPLPAVRRALKHPRAMHHHRLVALVLAANLTVLLLHRSRGDWHLDDGSALGALADLTLVNLAAAVLVRQSRLLNVVFALAGRTPARWPLRLRWAVSKINHIGGLHVGAAVAGTAWLGAFAVTALVTRAREPGVVDDLTLGAAGALAVLLAALCACAAPRTASAAGAPSRCSGC